jgi:hypothetical protein
LRWAVAAVNASEVVLELQSLPTNARYLTKPNLKADNTDSVLVSTFKLNADLFDGESISGPVPLIFAPDREATLAAFAANPDTLHGDISASQRAVPADGTPHTRRGGGLPSEREGQKGRRDSSFCYQWRVRTAVQESEATVNDRIGHR